MTDLLLILISDACGLLPLIRLYCVEIEITKTEKMYCQFRDMLSGWPPVSVGNSYACVLILLLVIILPKMFIPGHSAHHWYLWYPATSVLYRTRGQVGTYQGTYADIAEGDQHGRSLDPICYSVPSQMVVQKSANPKIDYACFLILLLPKCSCPGTRGTSRPGPIVGTCAEIPQYLGLVKDTWAGRYIPGHLSRHCRRRQTWKFYIS